MRNVLLDTSTVAPSISFTALVAAANTGGVMGPPSTACLSSTLRKGKPRYSDMRAILPSLFATRRSFRAR